MKIITTIITTIVTLAYLLLAIVTIAAILLNNGKASASQLFWIVISISVFWIGVFALSIINEKP